MPVSSSTSPGGCSRRKVGTGIVTVPSTPTTNNPLSKVNVAPSSAHSRVASPKFLVIAPLLCCDFRYLAEVSAAGSGAPPPGPRTRITPDTDRANGADVAFSVTDPAVELATAVVLS